MYYSDLTPEIILICGVLRLSGRPCKSDKVFTVNVTRTLGCRRSLIYAIILRIVYDHEFVIAF